MVNRFSPSIEAAEVLALQCVTEIVGDPALGPRFLSLTGLDVEGLRASLAARSTLAAAFDFLLGHEPTLVDIARRLDVTPAAIVAGAEALREGERP